ncbi:hypothetical protein vseg_001259 [Gypsophila vaccaria]
MSLINHLNKQVINDENASLAMCMASWMVPSMVFKTILDLKVLDIIHNVGPTAQLSPTEIAAQLPTKSPEGPLVLARLLRLLASFDILTCSRRAGPDGRVELVYGLGPVCRYFVGNDDGVSYAAFADLMHDEIVVDAWKHLKDAVLEGGIPFNRAHDMGVYEYLSKDTRFSKVFFEGMYHRSTIVSKVILEKYDGFKGISSLVDVGGATGVTLSMILAKYPNIRGINFDLPHIVKDAPSIPGVEHIGGDMYINVPSADAVFMKWTFLTGDDEKSVKLLKNCYKALPEEGKVIVCEYIVPESPENSLSAQTSFIFDATIMTVPGGIARTKPEYEALGKEAGFQGFRVVTFACDTWVMEYLKTR